MTTWRKILIITISSLLLLTGCGGSDASRSETSSGGSAAGGDICGLADATTVAAAVGVAAVEAQEHSAGCFFNGPKHTGVATFDLVLQLDLIEGDGAVKFGPTSDELGLGVVGSRLAENEDGWFSYSAVISDQRLTVANGQGPEDVYYDSPELRSIAQQALETWVSQTSG